MSARSPTPLRKAWLRWKSLRLPWRKKFLVGLDLTGNTYWEFKDTRSSTSTRLRRIVEYPTTVHHSDVSSKITPAWHQWLRHTRRDPPSLTEQAQDVARLENLKVLAAQADARWAAKGRIVGPPAGERAPQVPLFGGGMAMGGAAVGSGAGSQGRAEALPQGQEQVPDQEKHHLYRPSEVRGQEEATAPKRQAKEAKDDPWKQARGGPSEDWQPQGWDPNATVTKRR